MIMSNYRETDAVTHKLKYYCIKKTKKRTFIETN